MLFTAIKKVTQSQIQHVHRDLYHNPLMIALANTVNTIDADLKLFFTQIALIAGNKLKDIDQMIRTAQQGIASKFS